MLPLASKRSSTGRMSNFSYWASRTPRAMFSKSQKSAMLALSLGAAMKCFQLEEAEVYRLTQPSTACNNAPRCEIRGHSIGKFPAYDEVAAAQHPLRGSQP